MVVGFADAIEDRTFIDLPACLRPGDLLVINETRVIRARLRGIREPGGGRAEVLLLRPADGGPFDLRARSWRALVKPGRKLSIGVRVRFDDAGELTITHAFADGSRVVRFDDDVRLDELMTNYGELPLPPYVGSGNDARSARYQPMFARVPGSVAAPTASLHFTPRVLAALDARNISIVPLVLDIGIGTFKPMDTITIDEHTMHAERYAIPAATVEAIARAQRGGRRVVVAGTTALRALEASAAKHGFVHAEEGEADLFISPGFRFRVADVLLTNFHLPASTLLVLVSAFAGYDRVRAAYAHAILNGYRFYSFGDAMLLERS